MSALLVTGAVLAFGVRLAHSYLGERYVLIRLEHDGTACQARLGGAAG